MDGPLTMYLLVHDGLRHMTAEFEGAADDLDVDDHLAAAELADRLSWFARGIAGHEKGEEELLFPAIEEHVPRLSAAFAMDHEHIADRSLVLMRQAAATLGSLTSTGDRRAALRRLRRSAVALHEHQWLHIEKENQLLVPLALERVPEAQLGAIAGGMADLIEPTLRMELIEYLYTRQGDHDRERMLRFLMHALPPAGFAAVSGRLRQLGQQDGSWERVAAHVPELAEV